MVTDEIATIKKLTVDVPEEYRDWITYYPSQYEDVGPRSIKGIFNKIKST